MARPDAQAGHPARLLMPPLTPWPVRKSCQFLRPSSARAPWRQPLMSKNNSKNSGAAMQQIRSQVTERDGLFELEAGTDVLDSPRYNHDMAPTKVHERTWNKWHITALWIGMSVCVPTYTLGGVLTAYFGLSVGEALLAILLANLIVLIPLTCGWYSSRNSSWLSAFRSPSCMASLP